MAAIQISDTDIDDADEPEVQTHAMRPPRKKQAFKDLESTEVGYNQIRR